MEVLAHLLEATASSHRGAAKKGPWPASCADSEASSCPCSPGLPSSRTACTRSHNPAGNQQTLGLPAHQSTAISGGVAALLVLFTAREGLLGSCWAFGPGLWPGRLSTSDDVYRKLFSRVWLRST